MVRENFCWDAVLAKSRCTNAWDIWIFLVCFPSAECLDSLGCVENEGGRSRIKMLAVNLAFGWNGCFRKVPKEPMYFQSFISNQTNTMRILTTDKCDSVQISTFMAAADRGYWTSVTSHVLKQQNPRWSFVVRWMDLSSSRSSGDWALHGSPRHFGMKMTWLFHQQIN